MSETSFCDCVEDSHSYMSFCVLLQSAAVSDGGEYSITVSILQPQITSVYVWHRLDSS